MRNFEGMSKKNRTARVQPQNTDNTPPVVETDVDAEANQDGVNPSDSDVADTEVTTQEDPVVEATGITEVTPETSDVAAGEVTTPVVDPVEEPAVQEPAATVEPIVQEPKIVANQPTMVISDIKEEPIYPISTAIRARVRKLQYNNGEYVATFEKLIFNMFTEADAEVIVDKKYHKSIVHYLETVSSLPKLPGINDINRLRAIKRFKMVNKIS